MSFYTKKYKDDLFHVVLPCPGSWRFGLFLLLRVESLSVLTLVGIKVLLPWSNYEKIWEEGRVIPTKCRARLWGGVSKITKDFPWAQKKKHQSIYLSTVPNARLYNNWALNNLSICFWTVCMYCSILKNTNQQVLSSIHVIELFKLCIYMAKP